MLEMAQAMPINIGCVDLNQRKDFQARDGIGGADFSQVMSKPDYNNYSTTKNFSNQTKPNAYTQSRGKTQKKVLSITKKARKRSLQAWHTLIILITSGKKKHLQSRAYIHKLNHKT